MIGFNLNSSTASTIYLVLLGVFFLIMIVMTVTLIVSRSKRDDEDDIEDYNDAEDEASSEAAESDIEEQSFEDSTFSEEDSYMEDSAFSEEDSYMEDSAFSEEDSYMEDSAFSEEDSRMEDSAFFDDTISDDAYVNTFDEKKIEEAVQVNGDLEETAQLERISEEPERAEKASEVEQTEEAVQEQITAEDAQEETPPAEPKQLPELDSMQNVHEAEADGGENVSEERIAEEDNAFEELPETLVDSAFAPEPEETGLTNEALNASVKEAVALGAALSGMGTGLTASSMFGISEELDKGSRKRTQSKSTVPSTDDFYWYNKMDVAEKPSYKTAEMYYHYFNIAKDCIEDLLIEMYDCALVRTEEIRYIAYGIEPRAVSIREILTSGNHNYVQHQKLKEPTTQDLVRIYEKWCGYVDKLFEKVEIHADAFTIDEIRRLLYDFGRNDVDVLLEGK